MALKNQAGLIKIIDAVECMEKSLSCAICLEISSEPVETRCGHLFCRNCIRKVLSNTGECCPVCKFNLTRRGVSSSSQMGLCIQQLSKLIDAIRSDTNIDITSCLKTHYKKRAFLPSYSSSSPQSQEEIENQIPPSESDDNTQKNRQNKDDELSSKDELVEYPFHKPKEQTDDNLCSKIITAKPQLEASSLQLAALNSSPVQNENLLPPENTSGVTNKSKFTAESHNFDPKVNDDSDKSFEENRQCLKDISTRCNHNRSLTDQSTKTWSRVAKFGKELRRKSGINSLKNHKKPKLCVNVRDKSNLTNASLDYPPDRELSRQDRVDHDTDTNNSIVNRHEDDINVSDNEINKSVVEKVNPARLDQNNEIISKNKKPETLRIINSKICDENITSKDVNETDERLLNSGLEKSGSQGNKRGNKMDEEKKKHSDVASTSISAKTIISVNNAGKQLLEDNKENSTDVSSATDSGKSLFSANRANKKSSEENEKVSDATTKINSEKSVILENKMSKQMYKKKEMHCETSLSTNFEKLVDTANKGSKRSSNENEKIPESLKASTEKEAEKESHRRRTKRTQYANLTGNVVHFKKLGHLFKAQRKSVPFLYLGPLKSEISEIYSDSDSGNICKLCSSCQLSARSSLLQKQLFESSGRLNRAKSFESVNFNNPKLLPMPETSKSRINRYDRRENPFQIPSARKEQTISPKNFLQSRNSSTNVGSQSASTVVADNILPNQKQSPESSIIRRKRKRSESSDEEDQCTEKQKGKHVSKKVSKSPDQKDQFTNKQSDKRTSKNQSESPDRNDEWMEKQSGKRVTKNISESPDQHDEFTKKQSRKRVIKNVSESPHQQDEFTKKQSRKRSESPDQEDQFTNKQSDKHTSKNQSESPDRNDQWMENQSGKRVIKNVSEAPDQQDEFTKKQSRKRSESPDQEDKFTNKQSDKRTSKNQSESPDRNDQSMEKQSGKRVIKNVSEFPDQQDEFTKKQSRKRPESSDRDDQCTKKQSEKRASHELARGENDKSSSLDSLLNKTMHSLAPQSLQTEQLAEHEMDTTDLNNPSEHENVDVDPVEIDFAMKDAFQEANITLRRNLPRTLRKDSPVTIPDVPKNVSCAKSRDFIGVEARGSSRTYSDAIGQNSDVYEYGEGSEMHLSRASMMDITGEELMLKKFEEHLFGSKKSDGNNEKRSENNKECNENTADTLAVANRPSELEPLGQRVSVTNKVLVEQNQPLEIEDFIELTPTEQNLNRLNKLPETNIKIPQNCEQIKSAETPLRSAIRESEDAQIRTPGQLSTKICPLYQSTPKSSQVPKDRYLVNVYDHKEIQRSLKLNPLTTRLCILCSGLTSKQSEDVKYLSSLFNMHYTKKFTDDVTHVIVKTNDENNGACKTLKYLQGVAYRKWVLNFNWIVDCVAQRKLLNEEMYEVVDSTTLIAGPKKARSGEKGPFDGFVFYCVEPFQNISVPDYEDLLRKMGATVVQSLKELAAEESIFKIIAVQAECHEKKIIEWHQITKAVPVAQEWIVECISQYRLVSLLPFLQELVPQDILDLGFPEELIQDDDSDFMYDMST